MDTGHSQSLLHISYLELLAVHPAIKAFLPHLTGKVVLIKTDMTNLYYLQKHEDQISTVVSPSTKKLDVCSTTQHSVVRTVHTRSGQRLGRSPQQDMPTSPRVGTQYKGLTTIPLTIGTTRHRPICNTTEREMP